MKRDATKYFVCPNCLGDLALDSNDAELEVETGSLACSHCQQSYPVVRGVPRFVANEQYADTFGRQWLRWSKTQHDSVNGTTIFHDRLKKYTGWSLDTMGEMWWSTPGVDQAVLFTLSGRPQQP